jgi:hypothetical protein
MTDFVNPTSKTSLNTGQEIWNALNDALRDDLWKIYAILGEAHHLFGQATASFDSGLFEGTVVLCRASLESAFFLYLAKKWDNEGFIALEIPKALDGEDRYPEFDELSRGIRKKVKFTETQIQAISRIQKDGNFVAHFASRRTLELQKYSTALMEAAEGIDKNPNKYERLLAYNKIGERFQFWISRDKALENLRDTSTILLTLFNSMPKPQPASKRI